MDEIQAVKNRYKIIGNNPELNRSLAIAINVAPTDMSVLITGESGVGKDVFSKIIHDNSSRKNTGSIISVNCGAIPEGTIDSELFGHEKGSFTGAFRFRQYSGNPEQSVCLFQSLLSVITVYPQM